MRRYRVLLQPDAEAEIAEAFRYIYSQSPLNAERWLRGLYERVDTLRRLPRRCALARENDAFPQELRQMIYASHRIIFEVEGDVVRVLHVRHAARQQLEP